MEEWSVYIDGACSGNGSPWARAGVGTWWGEGSHMDRSQGVRGEQTNSEAEIQVAC